jgi:hypothetical protein
MGCTSCSTSPCACGDKRQGWLLGDGGTGLPPEAPSSDCPPVTMGPTTVDLYLYQGDDELRVCRWEDPIGTPAIDLTGADIEMQVRTNNVDFVNGLPPLFECSIGDGITITDGPNATFQLLISSAKTVLLTGSNPFLWDLQVTPLGGRRTTIFRGLVYFELERTR